MSNTATPDSYRKYIQTPKGRAARKRAYDNWNRKRNERRRQEREQATMTINPAPLAQVLSNWRPQ